MYRIFLVEDDDVIATAIAEGLTRWGFEPHICSDFQHVTEEFLACDPHLTLLDISLPFYNGYHWCSEIRKISKTPIMFISSAGDDMNVIMAINMGGDDFVAKPFEMQVLLTKIQALLRRSYDFNAPQETGALEHGGILLNTTACTVDYEVKRAELSKNENKILAILLEHAGEVVSRDAMMSQLWETDCFVDENTLSVNIARLRKTLASIGITDLIKTKKGIGYMIP